MSRDLPHSSEERRFCAPAPPRLLMGMKYNLEFETKNESNHLLLDYSC